MIKGLSVEEANQRLKQYGANIIEKKQKRSLAAIFIDQFNNFLTVLLLLASVISFFIREFTDGILIVSIIVLNAIFGVYQERKAEEAIEALQTMTITKVRVIRDGKQIEIDSRFLVPGDIVYIEEGVRIPADALIIEALHLELNEAMLTGESLPVVKESSDEAFMGTILVS